jgi:hypothetical protein
MSFVLIIALAGALVACVFALGREIRLRKALEKLLRIILSHWRKNVPKSPSDHLDSVHRTTPRRDQQL